MTPNASAGVWRPPTSRSQRWRLAGQWMLVGLVTLAVSQYLAGCALLWSLHQSPRSATPLTVARYAYYYGERADIRRRAAMSSAVGLGAALAGAVAFLLPRRR